MSNCVPDGIRRMYIAIISLCFLGGVTISCNRGIGSPPCATLNGDVEQYLRLAVALGERDPDSIDYYYGPAGLVIDIRKQPPTLREIKRSAENLSKLLKQHTTPGMENRRRDYLIGQVQAISRRVDMLTGLPKSFDDEAYSVFGVNLPANYNQGRTARVQMDLRRLLHGKGTLAEQYEAFDVGFIVPRSKLRAVMEAAIQGCRDATKSHISLPKGESTKLLFVHNRPWSGYSFYQGNYRTTVEINTDYALTVDRALQLACHETYPGHHAYNSMQEEKLERGRGMEELEVQPTFSPQSLISESAATLAIDVAFPPLTRLEFERKVLFPMAGLDGRKAERYLKMEALVDELHPAEYEIARDYLDGRLEFERANAALEERALMPHGESALKFMNEYRSYVMTYTYGRDLTASLLSDPRGKGETPHVNWTSYGKWMARAPDITNLEQGEPSKRNTADTRSGVPERNGQVAKQKQAVPVT